MRELTDGEFVTVMLEGVQPVEVLAIPRAAVLSDQQGDYVFMVGADNKAEQRRIQLGQSTPTIAAVISGLSLGRQGDRRGPAAGASRPAGRARAGERADPVQHEGRRKRRPHADR